MEASKGRAAAGPSRTSGLVGLAVLVAGLTGCIEERCREHRDCPGVKLCDPGSGRCVWECTADEQCGGEWMRCEDHTCQLTCRGEDLTCPGGMLSICGSFCMDVYEASRPDADGADGGSDESMATSRPGVIPWRYTETSGDVLTHEIAAAACEAAGKRLCTVQEWEAVCAGLGETVYVYGDEYDPATCNSIDFHCDAACGVYPLCYRDCGSDFHLMPTGSFPGCTNDFGVLDLSGNLWEAVASSDGADHFRGGAYNCGDPELAHQCGYDGLASYFLPFVKGFRCCADGDPS